MEVNKELSISGKITQINFKNGKAQVAFEDHDLEVGLNLPFNELMKLLVYLQKLQKSPEEVNHYSFIKSNDTLLFDEKALSLNVTLPDPGMDEVQVSSVKSSSTVSDKTKAEQAVEEPTASMNEKTTAKQDDPLKAYETFSEKPLVMYTENKTDHHASDYQAMSEQLLNDHFQQNEEANYQLPKSNGQYHSHALEKIDSLDAIPADLRTDSITNPDEDHYEEMNNSNELEEDNDDSFDDLPY